MVLGTTRSRDESRAASGSDQAARAGRWRAWRPDVIAFAVYAMFGVIVGGHYWRDVPNRISAHLETDHTWFEWLLAHGAFTVTHLTNPVFSEQQNAPDGVNVMANTSALGITIPLAPVTLLFGVQVSYLLWLCGGLIATAAASYWVLSRHLVASWGAALIAGAFLGFAPGVVHHANGQPNFVANFLLPFIVVRVLRLGQGVRWLRDGLILGLLIAYQVFINEEMLLLTALACAVTVVVYAVQRRAEARERARLFLASLGVAAGTTLVITAYPIWFQFFGPQSFRGVVGGAFHKWGEDPWAYVTFARDTLAGTDAAEATIGATEQNTWFGVPLVAFAVLAIVLLWRQSIVVRTAATVAAVFAVASLGPEITFQGRATGVPGPWAIVPDRLPLLEMMMPSRLSFVVVGAVGVLIAVAWDRVASAQSGDRAIRYLAHGAIVLALLPLIPTPLPAKYIAPPPQFITSGSWRAYVPANRTLVGVPVPSNGWGLPTLRWSAVTKHEFRIPAGYFIGPNAAGDGIFGAPQRPTARLLDEVARTGQIPQIGPTERAQVQADLVYWRAAVVVLGPQRRQDQLLTVLTQLLGAPRRVDDVWLWTVD